MRHPKTDAAVRHDAGAPIFCSGATREVLLRRWPDLSRNIFALDLGEFNTMTLAAPSGTVELNVILLDANHCLVCAQS